MHNLVMTLGKTHVHKQMTMTELRNLPHRIDNRCGTEKNEFKKSA